MAYFYTQLPGGFKFKSILEFRTRIKQRRERKLLNHTQEIRYVQ